MFIQQAGLAFTARVTKNVRGVLESKKPVLPIRYRKYENALILPGGIPGGSAV